MEREKAIEYLKRKGKLERLPKTKKEIEEDNEAKIQKVIKKGKIYGDPKAEIQW